MEIENCQIHGQVLQGSLYLLKNHMHGPVRDWQENKRPPDQTLCGKRLGKICPMRRNVKRSKSGRSRNQSSTMPEDCVVFYFIDPDDEEFKDIMKDARRKLEVPMPTAMPCKLQRDKYRDVVAQLKNTRQNTLALLKPMNLRGNAWKDLLTRIMKTTSQEKESTHLNHYNLVHKFIPVPKAMKIPDAKAAVEKEWGNSRKYQHGTWRESETKKEVVDQARKELKTVHFASLTDVCYLKNSELEPTHQKYEDRVAVRGDIVKDDAQHSIYRARFICVTAAKVMDILARLPGCAGQTADAVSAYIQVKMEVAPSLVKIPKSECPDVWARPPIHKWPKSWSSMEDPVVPLERNLFGHPLAGLLWERQFEKILLKHGWEKVSKLGMLIR